MTHEDQVKVCKDIVKSCMWGYSGVGSVILDRLNKSFPELSDWQEECRKIERDAKHEAVGVVTDEKELLRYIESDYFLCNYNPGELSVHYPSHSGGGLCKYVLGDLAEKYGQIYDQWNWNVYQQRKGVLINENH